MGAHWCAPPPGRLPYRFSTWSLPAVETASPRRGGKVGALSPSPSARPELGLLIAGVKGSLQRNHGTVRTREPRSQKLRSCPKIQGQNFHLFLDEVAGCGNQKKKKKKWSVLPYCTMVMTYAKHPLFLFLTRSQKLRQRTGCWLILLRHLSLNCINAIYAREHSRRGGKTVKDYCTRGILINSLLSGIEVFWATAFWELSRISWLNEADIQGEIIHLLKLN